MLRATALVAATLAVIVGGAAAGTGAYASSLSPPAAPPQVTTSAIPLPTVRVGIEPRRYDRGVARPASAPAVGCTIQPEVDVQHGRVIPTSVVFHVAVQCHDATVTSAGDWIINSREHLVSSRAACSSGVGSGCVARGRYRPRLGSYTRVLNLRGSAVMATTINGSVWVPVATGRTVKHCTGFSTTTLHCTWTDSFVTPDHRCDLTRFRSPASPEPPTFRLYPSSQNPLAPFIDGSGRESRLFWGFSHPASSTNGFWSGFGYEHIVAKHGWGPRDVQATRVAIHRRPVKIEKTYKRKQEVRIRRTYQGPRYRQNATSCVRVVEIDYPPRGSRAGDILSSYGAVVGEPGSTLLSQS